MPTMDNLDKIYKDHFKDTFDKLGFELYESLRGQMKFKNDSFRLQLLDDSGLVETDISPLFGQEEFRGIEMYNSLLTLNASSEKLSDSERKKILGTRLDYNSQTIFLTRNFERLQVLLNKDNFKRTLREIDAIGDERFKY